MVCTFALLCFVTYTRGLVGHERPRPLVLQAPGASSSAEVFPEADIGICVTRSIARENREKEDPWGATMALLGEDKCGDRNDEMPVEILLWSLQIDVR